jgi:hypothetical protein
MAEIQRNTTAKGVYFITIKGKTAITNLIVWPTVFEQYSHAILTHISPGQPADPHLLSPRADEKDGTIVPESLKNQGAAAMPQAHNFR